MLDFRCLPESSGERQLSAIPGLSRQNTVKELFSAQEQSEVNLNLLTSVANFVLTSAGAEWGLMENLPQTPEPPAEPIKRAY